MPSTKQIRTDAVESGYAPLYVVAGLTDLAVSTARSSIDRQLADLRSWQAVLAGKVGKVADQAATTRAELPQQIRTLPEQLRTLPEVAKAQLAAAQQQAEVAYADFAGRGKVAVDGALLTARRLQAQATSRVTRVADEAAGAAERAAGEAKQSTETARASAAGRAGGTSRAAKAAGTRQRTTRKTATATTATTATKATRATKSAAKSSASKES